MEANQTFYNRISEFGTYQYNLTKSTIFVYQLTFIVVLAIVVLYYFNRMGFISRPTLWLLTTIFLIVLTIIYINRFVVMPKILDKNNYDRVNFGDNTLLPAVPVKTAGVVGGQYGPPPPTESCVTPTPVCSETPSIY
jgi:hypothetical protein